MADVELRTARLWLRPWRDSDLPAFAAMNADPQVMEFFPKAYSLEESAEGLARIKRHFAAHGFGLWAVEQLREADPRGEAFVDRFVGMVGLAVPHFQAHFTPCVEVGWRLPVARWGHGYATEAARAAMAFGFEELRLPEIVAFTTTNNHRSRRVMERLGMSYTPDDDFMHPGLPDGHPLRPHVLYRMSRVGFFSP